MPMKEASLLMRLTRDGLWLEQWEWAYMNKPMKSPDREIHPEEGL